MNEGIIGQLLRVKECIGEFSDSTIKAMIQEIIDEVVENGK